MTILCELIETFVAGGVCYVDCCVEEHNLIIKYNPKNFQENLKVDEFHCSLFTVTHDTHGMTTHWNQIPIQAYEWSMDYVPQTNSSANWT